MASALLLGVVFLAVVSNWVTWQFSLIATLFLTALNRPRYENFSPVLAFPLHTLADYGKPLAGLALLLLFYKIIGKEFKNQQPVSSPMHRAFLIFQIVVCLRIAIAGYTTRSLASLAFFVLLYAVFARGAAYWLRNSADFEKSSYILPGAAGVLSLVTLYQLLINPMAIISPQLRLFGTTENPQLFGPFLAIAIPQLIYLGLKGGKFQQIGLTALGLLMSVFLIWTGSRTAFMMLAVGVAILLYSKLKRFSAVALLVGVWAAAFTAPNMTMDDFSDNSSAPPPIVGKAVSSDLLAAASRLGSTRDNRSVLFRALIEDFRENPLFGTLDAETWGVASQNSYLATAAKLGLMGLIPLLYVTQIAFGFALQIRRSRRGPDDLRPSLVLAGLGQMGFCTMTEGYVVGTLTVYILTLFLLFAQGEFLLRESRSTSSAPSREMSPEVLAPVSQLT